MTIFFHELKRNKIPLIIWSSVLSFMLAVCIIIYPEMASQMNEMTDLFANMGAFTEAFGMDNLNFGEFMGYFGIECGNTLGLGGALFAALAGISALSKEEKDKTADFLLTHPISRKKIAFEKLASVITQVIILNLAILLICTASTLAIGEKITADFYLILSSFLILQLEISIITFSLSAFIKKSGIGLGLGLAFVFYFLNIMANLTDALKVIKYLTPFSYTDSGYITQNHSLDFKYITVGFAISLTLLCFSFIKYNKKDV